MNKIETAKIIMKAYFDNVASDFSAIEEPLFENGVRLYPENLNSEFYKSLHHIIRIKTGRDSYQPHMGFLPDKDSANFHIEDEKKAALGLSKMYGLPHLPPDIEFPKKMFFLAQFNCAELSQHDASDLLPKNGMLYFFFNPDPDFTKSKVIYHNGSEETLKLTPYPKQKFPGAEDYLEEFLEQATKVEFESTYIFYYGSDSYDFTGGAEIIPEGLQMQLNTLLNSKLVPYDSNNRIFGKGFYWQGEDDESEKNPFEEEDQELTEEERVFIDHGKMASNHILLFVTEVGSGSYHFWITKEDLAEKNFANVRMTYSGT